MNSGFNALVFGSTGAIGAQLVELLLKSPRWSKVYCVVRKQLDEWKLKPGYQKLVIERFNDLDEYFQQKNDHYRQVTAVFCCLGSQVKHGEETFIKIDKTYPLLASDIALRNRIPHYLFFSSRSGDENSCLLYLKVKGEAERDLKLKKLNLLSILKPGILRNRRDARFGEKFLGVFPCVPGIQAVDSAQVMIMLVEKYADQSRGFNNRIDVYQNQDMVDIIETK